MLYDLCQWHFSNPDNLRQQLHLSRKDEESLRLEPLFSHAAPKERHESDNHPSQLNSRRQAKIKSNPNDDTIDWYVMEDGRLYSHLRSQGWHAGWRLHASCEADYEAWFADKSVTNAALKKALRSAYDDWIAETLEVQKDENIHRFNCNPIFLLKNGTM